MLIFGKINGRNRNEFVELGKESNFFYFGDLENLR